MNRNNVQQRSEEELFDEYCRIRRETSLSPRRRSSQRPVVPAVPDLGNHIERDKRHQDNRSKQRAPDSLGDVPSLTGTDGSSDQASDHLRDEEEESSPRDRRLLEAQNLVCDPLPGGHRRSTSPSGSDFRSVGNNNTTSLYPPVEVVNACQTTDSRGEIDDWYSEQYQDSRGYRRDHRNGSNPSVGDDVHRRNPRMQSPSSCWTDTEVPKKIPVERRPGAYASAGGGGSGHEQLMRHEDMLSEKMSELTHRDEQYHRRQVGRHYHAGGGWQGPGQGRGDNGGWQGSRQQEHHEERLFAHHDYISPAPPRPVPRPPPSSSYRTRDTEYRESYHPLHRQLRLSSTEFTHC